MKQFLYWRLPTTMADFSRLSAVSINCSKPTPIFFKMSLKYEVLPIFMARSTALSWLLYASALRLLCVSAEVFLPSCGMLTFQRSLFCSMRWPWMPILCSNVDVKITQKRQKRRFLSSIPILDFISIYWTRFEYVQTLKYLEPHTLSNVLHTHIIIYVYIIIIIICVYIRVFHYYYSIFLTYFVHFMNNVLQSYVCSGHDDFFHHVCEIICTTD